MMAPTALLLPLLALLVATCGRGAVAATCNLTGDWAMPDGHGQLLQAVGETESQSAKNAAGAVAVHGQCCDHPQQLQLTCVGRLEGSTIGLQFFNSHGQKHGTSGPESVAANCSAILSLDGNPKSTWHRIGPYTPPSPSPTPPAPPPPPPPAPPAPPAPHHPVPAAAAADVVAAGQALLARVLPLSHATQFDVQAIPCDPASGNEALEYGELFCACTLWSAAAARTDGNVSPLLQSPGPTRRSRCGAAQGWRSLPRSTGT
jgi:hypothetical protein